MPLNHNTSVNADAIRTHSREAIGAFCLDIKDSTERIEQFQEEALKHHKTFLESAGRFFLKSVPKGSRNRYVSGDLWVPGDALWGVFHREAGCDVNESVAISLWRLLLSTAYGLSLCNSALPNSLEALRMKGVFLAGRVLRETVFRRLRLYNGRALNACGRLEKSVDANTIIAGFVVADDDGGTRPLFESVIGSPVIDLLRFKHELRTLPEAPGLGYDIAADVVTDTDRKLLRFTGWRTRSDLRGLGKCKVLTTNFTFFPKKEPSIDLTYAYSGEWLRVQKHLTLSDSKSQWDLLELLDVAECEAFSFLKKVYEAGDIEFSVSLNPSVFKLLCHRKTDRPRILKEEIKTNIVDFTQHSYCTLPTFTHTISTGCALFIQARSSQGERALRFSKISHEMLKAYEDYADYMDSGDVSIEFVFRRP